MLPFLSSRKRLFAICSRALIIAILFGLPHLSAASNKEVRIGVYENFPKVFSRPDGTPAGIFIDIIQEIAHREKWTLHYVHGTWPECLQRLSAGEIDVMLDVAYSPEREKIYDFCVDDVLSNWAQIYTRGGLKIELITDLADMRIATLRGGIHLTRLQNLADGFGFRFELTQVDDYESVFKLLNDKSVDAGVVNRIYGYKNEDRFNVVRSPVVFSPASLRFAVKKGENALVLAAIDRQLSALKKEKASVYHQSLRRWLGETNKLDFPKWIIWTLGVAGTGILLLFIMSVLLKHQVNRKTAHLHFANRQLEKQVNETMRAHLELKRSEELLIRQERLSALGQLSSGIAHDFNNMLIPILGYSDLLLQDPSLFDDRERVLKMVASIRAAAVTSRDTVKRLQEFNRADTRPRMEPVIVAELVAEVVEAVKPLWKSDREAHSIPISIVQEVPPELVVTLSKSQFNEALMNLLLNALDAISCGGQMTIRAFVKAEHFYLQVEDTGTGMSTEVARQCLEPFFSTKGKKGTGIGLAMVHGIVKRHNGALNIDSVPELGTTITLKIPLAQSDTGARIVPSFAPTISKSLKVLVVDDDSNSRSLLSEYLALDGHHVMSADDTATAITAFDRDKFDMVITDRAMPGNSGDSLAEHILSSGRKVPVLMVTGFAQIMASQGDQPPGVDHVMGKPFTLEELRSAFDRAYSIGTKSK